MSTNDEIEKQTREVLGNSKSSTAKALVLMSMSIDKMTTAIIDNQTKTDKRLIEIETNTNNRFEKLKFFEFMGSHGWVAVLVMISVIIVIIWSVATKDPIVAAKILK